VGSPVRRYASRCRVSYYHSHLVLNIVHFMNVLVVARFQILCIKCVKV